MGWQVYVPIIVGIFVLFGVMLAAIPRTRRRPTERPRDATRPPTREDATRPGGVTAPDRTRERAETPTIPAPAAPPPIAPTVPPEVPAAPEIEQPAPTAGRLIRLRSRLSRSQGVFGKGLLTLLSRDHLDDEAWEDLEDTLIGADVGVDATHDIVGRLKEKSRVAGTRSERDLRQLAVIGVEIQLVAQDGDERLGETLGR